MSYQCIPLETKEYEATLAKLMEAPAKAKKFNNYRDKYKHIAKAIEALWYEPIHLPELSRVRWGLSLRENRQTLHCDTTHYNPVIRHNILDSCERELVTVGKGDSHAIITRAGPMHWVAKCRRCWVFGCMQFNMIGI